MVFLLNHVAFLDFNILEIMLRHVLRQLLFAALLSKVKVYMYALSRHLVTDLKYIK